MLEHRCEAVIFTGELLMRIYGLGARCEELLQPRARLETLLLGPGLEVPGRNRLT